MLVAMLISNKIDFRAKNITMNKEGHLIMIKGSIHQEDITILKVHWFNNSTLKYMKSKQDYKKLILQNYSQRDQHFFLNNQQNQVAKKSLRIQKTSILLKSVLSLNRSIHLTQFQ